MTIKRRLFFSNLRMVLISFAAFGVIGRVVAFIMHGSDGLNRELMKTVLDSINRDTLRAAWVLFIAFSLILISLINNYLTHRMTKRITKPLEPLGEGVRQIQANNLSFRIDYQEKDEFYPVCEAFNEMAAKLETSTAQKEKDEANRRELIAGISHDLLTPLTSIMVSLEGLEKGVASTPALQNKYHSHIRNEAANMKHIIQQLFLFSKLDMDEFPLNLMATDICLAISEMLEDSLAGYKERGLNIHISGFPKNVFVNADVFLLRSVVTNIIENSIKYKIEEHGQMEITAAVQDNHILFRFADDGPGVKPDMLEKLFDVFYRADPSRTGHSSGLGLPISAKIIQSMSGTINADLPPSGGLVIVIRLPISQGEAK
jgi:signal transduction histidine kinase